MAVKSSRSAFLVLRALAEAARPMSAGELAAALGLPATTVARALVTLEAAGYSRRWQASPRHVLGPAARPLAFAVLTQFPARDLALPFLQRLAVETDCTASIFVRLGDAAIRAAAAPGGAMLQPAAPIGESRPLGEGAAGLAILAHLPPAERARLAPGADPDRPAELPATAPNPTAPEATDLAVPLLDAAGHPVAAVVIEAIPAHRLAALSDPEGPARRIAEELAFHARRELTAGAEPFAHLDLSGV